MNCLGIQLLSTSIFAPRYTGRMYPIHSPHRIRQGTYTRLFQRYQLATFACPGTWYMILSHCRRTFQVGIEKYKSRRSKIARAGTHTR